ncbi:MAG: tyrosine-type recombinase/integrase [Bacteroidota bacterium]
MATAKKFLDTRKSVDENGIIKLRITHNRIQKDYSTKIKISPDDYEKIKSSEIDNRIKNKDLINFHNLLFAKKDNNRNIKIDGFVLRANKIIEELGVNFNFDTFKDLWDNYDIKKEIVKHDVISFLDNKRNTLKAKGQISHGVVFGLVGKSLGRFVQYLKEEYPNKLTGYKKNKPYILEFHHLTSDFLSDWQDWLLVEGKAPKKESGTPTGTTITTVGIYSRTLRVAFNEAISQNLIDKSLYPFGRDGFTIPKGRNIKKALSNAQLESIKNYQPEPFSTEQRSHDLWLFSYFGNGMNFEDMLRLTWGNIRDTGIYFERNKTKGKSSEETTIHVRINETMRGVLERQATKRKKDTDLVFPFLNPKDTPERQKATIHQVIKVNNIWMNRIGQKLGIEEKLNTYEARHSFATKLMRSNAPLMMISQKLGHAQISTTESYLGSFEKETEDTFLDML